jgi:hypothetical protein
MKGSRLMMRFGDERFQLAAGQTKSFTQRRKEKRQDLEGVEFYLYAYVFLCVFASLRLCVRIKKKGDLLLPASRLCFFNAFRTHDRKRPVALLL